MPSSDPGSALILASGSPRRKELFERLFGSSGFRTAPVDFDESLVPRHRRPARYAADVSRAKCEAFLAAHPEESGLVVTADTVVSIGRTLLGKPADAEEATAMLRMLSGRRHRVHTAVSLAACPDGPVVTGVESTDVWFARLDDAWIDWYVSTGEPMDKAGAYGIQELGAALVVRIAGCYSNVVGLPVQRLIRMMEQYDRTRGSRHFISGHLPWRQANQPGGKHGEPDGDQPDQGHSQGTATV